MEIRENDVVILRKAHPCGSHEWKIMRVGADFRIQCLGCGHQLMIPRSKLEKSIKEIKKSLEI